MKQLLLFSVLGILFIACNRNNDPEPAREIAGIVGKWRMVELQYTQGDRTIVQPGDLEDVPQSELSIRFDGVILTNGYGACCPIEQYMVNGKLFEVKPARQVPLNPNCINISCMMCADVEIVQLEDEMTITSCKALVVRYTRVK